MPCFLVILISVKKNLYSREYMDFLYLTNSNHLNETLSFTIWTHFKERIWGWKLKTLLNKPIINNYWRKLGVVYCWRWCSVVANGHGKANHWLLLLMIPVEILGTSLYQIWKTISVAFQIFRWRFVHTSTSKWWVG
jgi:hypothetical protein